MRDRENLTRFDLGADETGETCFKCQNTGGWIVLTRLVEKLSVSLDKCHGSIFNHIILNDLS